MSSWTALISPVKMEDKEGLNFGGRFNKLICEEDVGTDGPEEKQQVSMSMGRPESSHNHYTVLTASLAVLAFVLLAADIGLGVYYSRLTDGQQTITDINREVAKLQAGYDAATRARDEVKQQLSREIREQQNTQWELEHQTRRCKDYEKQVDKIQTEVATLKSHIPMMQEGCRHCLPGWTYMNSLCYYLAFSETLSRRTWNEARQFCKRHGSDLAVIDNTEKNLALFNLVNNYADPSRPIALSGFWLGLRDIDVEGTWKWVDGRRLSEGYWNDGEPNDNSNEDCAAMYPRTNPFKAWNDAPCAYNLKWICEMEPRSG